MKKTSDRRAFIRNVGLGTLGATALPLQIAKGAERKPSPAPTENLETPRAKKQSRPYNSPYTGEHLTQLAFPIGGLGAGMFCLEGTGAISHMSVKNKPDIFNVPNIFAAISIKGLTNGAKVLEGPPPNWKKFGQRDAGNGATGATTGLPRFRQASCNIRFPFSHIDLADQDMPLKVRLTGWSPFIPTDENNSSLPLGALEYSFKNTGEQNIEAIFSINSPNFVRVNQGNNLIRSLPNGFILTEEGTKADPLRTDFAFFTEEANTLVDHCWFRGGWWDPLTMAWNTVKNAEAKSVPPVEKNAPGASLYVPFSLAKGQEKTIKVFVAWYTPDTKQAIGTMGIRKENCDPESGCCNSPGDIGLDKYDQDYAGEFFKPWYSSQFKNIEDLAAFWKKQYPELRKNTLLFSDAFYKSTLPPEVVEAVAANLSILKSPTVMRQYDGRLWNFEGCGDSGGCCHGSCTHVWNYAQATAHLFPALERSLRNTEFCESQDDKGHQNFRSRLPITPSTHDFHAAADGQLGGILKVYREWRISGDDTWMRKIYPMVKKSLDYCISTWDPAEKGVTEEPHHNTYDIEFWGADGMHSSFYLGALNALIAMGTYLKKDVSRYQKILDKGKIEMEGRLYDGEYFIQDIQFKGLKAEDPTKTQSFGGEYSKEAKDLLDKEGPKYQYGKGCLSDGVLGSWIAVMCGLNDVVDPIKIKSHLKAVHKYNLKHDLSEHANPQRPSFAFGDDGGLLLCSWPKGGKLSLPFVYSDEVWTGIEHQVASHLMLMGQVKEGLEILQVSRNRYDGRIRNPFNEYECGHWYGRALSSYGYLQALTGVRYDAVEKTLYVDSKIGDFTSFICTETGFGTVSLKAGKVSVQVAYGKIEVQKTQIKGKSS